MKRYQLRSVRESQYLPEPHRAKLYAGNSTTKRAFDAGVTAFFMRALCAYQRKGARLWWALGYECAQKRGAFIRDLDRTDRDFGIAAVGAGEPRPLADKDTGTRYIELRYPGLMPAASRSGRTVVKVIP